MSLFHETKAGDWQGNPFTLIGKGWMLITAGGDKPGDACNTMTASWGGLGVMWNKNVAFVVLRPQRYTKEFVDRQTRFSLSFLGEEHRKNLGYLGTVSGRDVDKIGKTGLVVTREDGVPFFEAAHTAMMCKKLFAQPYEASAFLAPDFLPEWYPEKDLHTLYIAEVEKILTRTI